MRSSLSMHTNRQKSTKFNFLKDIIIPNIYGAENSQILKNNSYPVHKVRKVISAKKAKIESQIEGIISKRVIEVSKKVPKYVHRLAKPSKNNTALKTTQGFTVVELDNFDMDIDKNINEKAFYYDEQIKIGEERYQEIKERTLKKIIKNQHGVKEEVKFYLTQLSPKKQPTSMQEIYIANPMLKKDYLGFVEEHEKVEKFRQERNRRDNIVTKTQMNQKYRPKSAIDIASTPKKQSNGKEKLLKTSSNFKQTLFRNNSLLNTKLMRYEHGSDITGNLKNSQRYFEDKQKMKPLFDRIYSNCQQNSKEKGKLVTEMNKLSMVWKSENQFLGRGVTVMQISQETLDLIQSIRKQERQMQKLDNQFLNNSKQAVNKTNGIFI